MDIEGKKISKEKLLELKEKIIKIDDKIGLTVIQVGDDKASNVYIKSKTNAATLVGFNFKHIKLDENIKQEDLLSIIEKENNDKNVHGIITQMPIPKHLNSKLVQNKVDENKDVDGLTDINAGKLMHNEDTLVPCTPLGVIKLLNYYNIEIEGKDVVIIGRSDLVGKPLAALFLNNNATVTICHSKTKNIKKYTKNADIIVVAVGIPKFLTKDMVSENQVIIDIGINKVEGKLIGDADYENIKEKASYITPVPGGAGPMTVSMLMENTYKAYQKTKNK